MKIADFLAIRWRKQTSPLIEPPRFSPIIADPSFLFPEETPEATWELFAHSAWGIHRYSSPDGHVWQDKGIVIRNAMRPFIRYMTRKPDEWGGGAGNYFLFFEAYRPFALPFTALPLRPRWHSTLAVSTSGNLEIWSRHRTLLKPALTWMKDTKLGSSISNPCLVEDGLGKCRLYFSASLAWIPDCGFCEPRYIGLAMGSDPGGPFTAAPRPLVDPTTDPMPGVLGAGSLKVIRLEDGWIGLQNKIYRSADGKSRSAIFILRSEDGLSWIPARPEPLIAPTAGWMASHVYACDCRFSEADGLWHLYFNARDSWRINDGIERIGKLVGEPGVPS